MTVDIRATVTCSLGPLISASVSDDYIQGSGLIKTSGSCEISGLVSPAIGSVVTFNYTKSGITRNVPRKLRVLSSFADPFRRTTKVELGCKLTYLSDLKDPIKWNAFNDPENEELTQADTIVTLPISAQSVAAECLARLGLNTSGLSLTNRFSVAEFDFSPGYVQVLSDLLVSESKFGYLDYSEILQVQTLYAIGGSGPSFGQSKLIDLGPIGVGDLPGDAVVVSYNTLKLKAPDDEEVVCRDASEGEEEEENASLESAWGADLVKNVGSGSATFAYRYPEDGPLQFSTHNWEEYTEETTQYKLFNVYESGTVTEIVPALLDRPAYPNNPGSVREDPVVERRNLVTKRTLYQKSGSAGVAGGYAQESLNNGFRFGNFDVFKYTVDQFSYDNQGREVLRVSTVYGSLLYQYGTAGINFVYDTPSGGKDRVSIGQGTGNLEKIIVRTIYADNIVKRVTERYGPWMETIAGQQAIARARESVDSVAEANLLLNQLTGSLYLLDISVETSIEGSRSAQEVPSEEEANKEDLVEDTGDPGNGFSTSSTAGLELATGSASATRRIELSMPYAPDDTFERRTVSTDPLRYCYYSSKSDAAAKANLYGRTQNRILFGNRNGMNIQTVPELLPTAPFAPYYLSVNGVVTQYRTNGTSWTMDSNGVVASTDGLYWGVVGKAA